MSWRAILLLLPVALISCDYFKPKQPSKAVARVYDQFLYEEDLMPIIQQATQKEDSALIVQNFINKWATQQLLIKQANINLSSQQLQEFEKLVNQYKTDLYTEAYKSNMVALQIDSTLSKNQIEDYYNQNKENFKLNDELYKIRYIQVGTNFLNIASIAERLNRFNKKDQEALEKLNIQFKVFNFNDSTWVKRETLLETFPILIDKEKNVLQKNNFVQLKDSLGIYLFKVEDKLERNDVVPLSFIKPTIENILLNRKKQELITKLEKDITTDALKRNHFEIYE